MQRINLSSILQTLVMLAFILLITFSPSIHFISYIEFHDCQRILQLLLLGLVLVDAVTLNFTKVNLGGTNTIAVNNKLRFGLYAVLGLAVASSVRAMEPRQATIEVTIFIALCYLTLFVARLYRDNKVLLIKYLTYALIASAVLYMVSFYVGYITALVYRKPLYWPFPFYGFSNIRLFQQYQLWTLGLICLPLLTFELKKNVRFILYVTLTCWWVLLFYAASRGVIMGWFLAILASGMLYKRLAWPFLRVQFINAITGLGGYLLLFKAIPSWTASVVTHTAGATTAGVILRATVTDRIDLWKVAYVMIKNFPFFGVGPMNFYFYNSFGTHPHNSILQLAAEWGLPATAIILFILGYSAHCWYIRFNAHKLQAESKLNAYLAIILFFTVVANGAYSLVDGVIVMPISQVLMFTMIGLMIGQYLEGRTEPSQSPRKFHFRPILAGITLVLLVLSTKPELVRGLTSYERYYQPGERAFSMGPNMINPRIWMQQRRIEPNAQKSQENKDAN